ncbi:hypothetical protein [Kiloniella sp. EL199]|uniref:hypothetical protein n=1 Tax=Kiloniella sp. EL199 TaxID=2107581 RepID=UPI000EA1871D|nr:hypothetical protein [Kiloniella sp. EL199]
MKNTTNIFDILSPIYRDTFVKLYTRLSDMESKGSSPWFRGHLTIAQQILEQKQGFFDIALFDYNE